MKKGAALFLGVVIILCDMVSKWWAQLYCMEPKNINSWLSFICIKNYGMSFGFFALHNVYAHLVFSCLIALFIGIFARYAYSRLKAFTFSEVIIIAGGLGNVCDRFAYGAVIDFIKIGYGGWTFPIFNGADIAISVGVLLLLYNIVRGTYE